MNKFIFLFFMLISQMILAKNDFPLNSKSKSKNTYLSILELAASKVKPLYDSQGLKLSVGSIWNFDTANAYAFPPSNQVATILFLGGLYRDKNIDNDGFVLLFCHEVGHHLAGGPLNGLGLSVEGQADYFATHTCLPLMFSDQDNAAWIQRNKVSMRVMQLCNRVWGAETERSYVCQRTLSASEGVSLLFNSNQDNKPNLWSKDHSYVETTNTSHPAAQCRLDTFVAGATCNTEDNPGRYKGEICSLHQAIERKAVRPSCWFAN